MTKPTSAFTVCYKSWTDGAWIPMYGFRRDEIAGAVDMARRAGHSQSLRSAWCLKRGAKTILRVPVPQHA